jgi:hypothetical protein
MPLDMRIDSIASTIDSRVIQNINPSINMITIIKAAASITYRTLYILEV